MAIPVRPSRTADTRCYRALEIAAGIREGVGSKIYNNVSITRVASNKGVRHGVRLIFMHDLCRNTLGWDAASTSGTGAGAHYRGTLTLSRGGARRDLVPDGCIVLRARSRDGSNQKGYLCLRN